MQKKTSPSSVSLRVQQKVTANSVVKFKKKKRIFENETMGRMVCNGPLHFKVALQYTHNFSIAEMT